MGDLNAQESEIRDHQEDGKGSWAGAGCIVTGLLLPILYILSPPWSFKICLLLSPGTDPLKLSQKVEWIYPAHVWLFENSEFFERVWLQYMSLYDF